MLSSKQLADSLNHFYSKQIISKMGLSFLGAVGVTFHNLERIKSVQGD